MDDFDVLQRDRLRTREDAARSEQQFYDAADDAGTRRVGILFGVLLTLLAAGLAVSVLMIADALRLLREMGVL